MPFPKISTILNNCPFYVLTPELKDEIAKYAADEAHDNGHNAQYTLLKQHFGAYYGIDPLSWKDFSGILKNYNAHDTQFILGPVLRNFSKEMMQKGDQEELMLMAIGNDIYDTEQYVKATTEINPDNGRYDSLAPDHLFKYVGAPLGLSVTYNKTGNPSQTFDADRPVAAISIYHHGNIEGAQAGGHWERVQNRDDAIDYESAVDSQLTPLLPLLGDNATMNTLGINLLKKHVQLMHRHEKDNYDMTADVQEIMLTSAQTQQYMWNINYLPKPLAVKLLGDNLTEGTKKLIEDMVIGHIDREPIIQRYFEAPLGNKPQVAADAREIITKLEQGVRVPQVFIPPIKKEEAVDLVDDVIDDVVLHPVELEEQDLVHEEVHSPVSIAQVDEVLQGKEPKKDSKPKTGLDKEDTVQVDTVVHEAPIKASKPKKKAVVKDDVMPHVDPLVHAQPQITVNATKPKKDNVPKAKKKLVVENHGDAIEHVIHPPIQQVEAIDKEQVHLKKEEPQVDDLHEEEILATHNVQAPIHEHPEVIHNDPVIVPPQEIKPEPKKEVFPEINNIIYKRSEFNKRMQELATQVESLKGRRDKEPVNSEDYQKLDAAYNKANKVHDILDKNGKKYFNKEISYAEFKRNADDAVKDARPVLENHRGGKEALEVILNLVLFLAVLARSAWNGKMTFFKVDTESVKKVDALVESVNKAAPGA